MKNLYIKTLFLLLFASSEAMAQQPTWTVYNDSNSAIPDNLTTCIAIDQAGAVWAGSNYSGLYKFSGNTWTHYDDFNSNIGYYDVDDLLIDNTGKIWVGHYKGISVFNGTTFTNYDTVNAGFKGQSVYKMNKDNEGRIWMSSKNGSFGNASITIYDNGTWTNLDQTNMPSQVIDDEVNGYAFAANNDVWMATESGMLKYNNGTYTYYPPAATELWGGDAMTKDADGNIWTGGFDGLLKRDVTNNTWTFYENVSDLGFSSANTIYYDIMADGDFLWLATTGGFVKFNRKTAQVVANYKTGNSPLETNGVTGITKDQSGNIWLSSSVGVVKMSFGTTGLNDNSVEPSVSLYPNPSNNGIYHITSTTHAAVNYKVYTIDGALISDCHSFAIQHQIDISTAAPGLYFLHTYTANGATKVSKLIRN